MLDVNPAHWHPQEVKVENIDYNVSQAKSSENGSRWHRIGQARKHGRGFWLRMDVLPIPNEKGEIWLNLFERMDEDGVQKKDDQKAFEETIYANRSESIG